METTDAAIATRPAPHALRVAVGVPAGDGAAAPLWWAAEEAVALGGRLAVCHVRAAGEPGAAPDALAAFAGSAPDSLAGFAGSAPDPLAAFAGSVPDSLAAFEDSVPDPLAAFAGPVPDPLAAREGSAPDPLAALEGSAPGLARRIRSCRRRIGAAQVAVELPTGDVADRLRALSGRADLLVLGASPASAARPSVVVTEVAARAACPLVVVRPSTGGGRGPFAGHVVVAVDGARGSDAALRFGFEYAARHRRPLAAVHVERPRPLDYWFDDRFLETCFATEPAALTMLARRVEPVAARHPSVAVKRAVFGGGVLPGLRRSAEGADLLVVARRDHPVRPALCAGSVARAFAERAGCTVAIVPG